MLTNLHPLAFCQFCQPRHRSVQSCWEAYRCQRVVHGPPLNGTWVHVDAAMVCNNSRNSGRVWKEEKRNYENAWRLNRFEGYPNLWTNPAAGRLWDYQEVRSVFARENKLLARWRKSQEAEIGHIMIYIYSCRGYNSNFWEKLPWLYHLYLAA